MTGGVWEGPNTSVDVEKNRLAVAAYFPSSTWLDIYAAVVLGNLTAYMVLYAAGVV